VPIRLRGPQGIATIQVTLDAPVSDLQQAVFAATDIPATLQDLRAGYPPVALTLVPNLPVSSLGVRRGDMIIVSSAVKDLADPAPARTTLSNERKPSSPPTLVNRKPLSHLADANDSSTAPTESKPSRPPALAADMNDAVPVDGGFLILRAVPDDNSCLFSCIALTFEQDIKAAPKLRQVIADAIRENPVQFNDVFLGRPRDEYISMILKSTAWGGAIELMIFADYYQTEISSFDIETGRCDRFGEGSYESRCIVMYSGIHYDATSLAPTESTSPVFHQTVFPVFSAPIMLAAEKLASKLRLKKAFTNTTTFDLRCQVCGHGLKGEREARQHAKDTGHVEFGEY